MGISGSHYCVYGDSDCPIQWITVHPADLCYPLQIAAQVHGTCTHNRDIGSITHLIMLANIQTLHPDCAQCV